MYVDQMYYVCASTSTSTWMNDEWCLFRDSIYNQYKTNIKLNFITRYYPVVLPKEPSSVTIPLLSNTLE